MWYCIDGEEYNGSSIRLVDVPAGEMTQPFTVVISDNDIVECDETLIVTILSSISCRVAIGNTNRSEVRIIDDDSKWNYILYLFIARNVDHLTYPTFPICMGRCMYTKLYSNLKCLLASGCFSQSLVISPIFVAQGLISEQWLGWKRSSWILVNHIAVIRRSQCIAWRHSPTIIFLLPKS